MNARADTQRPIDAETGLERASLELFLAGARAIVALAAFIASRLGPLEPTTDSFAVSPAFLAYTVYAMGVAGALQFRRGAAVRAGVALHVVDLCWAAALTSLTGGPSSHYSPPLFVFALLGAAYRWGYRETVITGAVGAGLLVAEAVTAAGGVLGVPLRLGDLVWKAVWLLMVASILGYLAERDKRLRAESAMLARISGRVRVQDGLGASVRAVLDELRTEFGARQVILASEELTTRRVYAWTSRSTLVPDDGTNRPVEVAAPQREEYLFPVPPEADAWAARRGRPGASPDGLFIRAVGADGHRVACRFPVPDRVAGDTQWQSLMGAATGAVEGWAIRVLFIDPDPEAGLGRRLRFLQTVVRQAGPAVVNVYLVRRLRSKVEEVERARLAKELHDGVVQALIGLELQVDVARRETELSPARAAATLNHVQRLLRDEVVDLRRLLAYLRPSRVDCQSLVRVVAGIVETYSRISGIDARLTSPVDTVNLPSRTCRDLVHLVEEALVNARKHGGATAVTVSLRPDTETCYLAIEDNGRGFPFTGRLSDADLDARGAGPSAIRERVRTLGGTLSIDSTPGQGARIEIAVPTLNG